MRMLTAASLFLALASAFLLYGLNYDTRRLAAEIGAAERQAEKIRTDIAVLKAERAHLAAPERIEPMARAMGLVPAAGIQFRKSIADDVADAGQ